MTKLRVEKEGYNGYVVIGKEPLGRGGEGSVYEVFNNTLENLPQADQLVAKIYHDPTQGQREDKIIAMVKNQPTDPAVAFPLAWLRDENNKFVGYVMKKLDTKEYRIWYELAHQQARSEATHNFTVRYALAACYNLALAINSVHTAGHCLGDINESNIFVGNDAGVFIVDTDSAQISAKDGSIYRCLVGKPEYTAPELTYDSFKNQYRTTSTDIFAYSVVIYQMITGGAHPTMGVDLMNENPMETVDRIRRSIYPNLRSTYGFKPLKRIPAAGIPTEIRKLILAGLDENPKNRPNITEFVEVIGMVIQNLRQCKNVSAHWYDKSDKKCLWCATLTGPDVWGGTELEVIEEEVIEDDRTTFSDYKTKRVNLRKMNGKTLLEYTDGGVRPRPRLSKIWYQDPRIAVKCIISELPEFYRWSYNPNRMLNTRGVIIASVVAVAVLVGWFYALPTILGVYFTGSFWLLNLIYFSGLIATLFTFLAFLNRLYHLQKIKNISKGDAEEMNVADSVWDMAKTPIAFGPPLVFGLILLSFMSMLKVIGDLIEEQ